MVWLNVNGKSAVRPHKYWKFQLLRHGRWCVKNKEKTTKMYKNVPCGKSEM